MTTITKWHTYCATEKCVLIQESADPRGHARGVHAFCTRHARVLQRVACVYPRDAPRGRKTASQLYLYTPQRNRNTCARTNTFTRVFSDTNSHIQLAYSRIGVMHAVDITAVSEKKKRFVKYGLCCFLLKYNNTTPFTIYDQICTLYKVQCTVYVDHSTQYIHNNT